MLIISIIAYIVIGAVLFGFFSAVNEDVPEKDRIREADKVYMFIAVMVMWPLILLAFVGNKIYQNAKKAS